MVKNSISTTINVVLNLRESCSLYKLVSKEPELVSDCGMIAEIFEIRWKVVTPDVQGVAHDTYLVFPTEVAGRCLKYALCTPTYLAWFSWVHLVFLTDEISQKQAQNLHFCFLSKLVPNKSHVLEQMHVFFYKIYY